MPLVEPVYSKPDKDRRPYPLEMMRRIHFMQQWCSLSDLTMAGEKAPDRNPYGAGQPKSGAVLESASHFL